MYLIDSNIFLEVLLEQKKSEECKTFLEKVKDGKISCFISNFNLDSILLIVWSKTNDIKPMKDFLLSMLSYDGLSFYSISMEDRINALKHMKLYNLDFEDSLTLQAAISTRSKIISFDKHFDKLPVKRLEPKDIIDL